MKIKKLLFLFIPTVLLAASCSQKESTLTPSASNLIDTVPGSCPNLTQDSKGNIVLSWVRKVNDTTEVFCYATSTDGGNTFGDPVVITPSYTIKPHAENLPKVIFKPSGEILAIWGTESNSTKNKYAGSISYAQSFDNGATWTAAKPLVRDTEGYDQRYFDVALLPNGEAAIIWLDNRKTTPQDGSALFYATTNGINGFSGEKRLLQPTCQCCRTKLFIDSKNNIHAVFRGIIQDSIRDMVHVVSSDGGKTFSAPRRISNDNWVINACPHTGPTMTENSDGLHFTWYTGGKQEGALYTSLKNGSSSFQQPATLSEKGKHPQMTAAPDGTLATVWDETVKKGDKTFTQIGLQLQAKNGNILHKGFISPDTINATYPVITVAGGKQPVIAYTQKKNGKNYVAYQLLKL